MNQQISLFDQTMKDLENNLQVRHITTLNPVTCATSDQVTEILSRYPDFDHFPVREGATVSGILSRDDSLQDSQSTVRECMQPLDERCLVAAEQPLLPFLAVLVEPPYFRLVLEGTQIIGIVTRSDTLNLPVRLLGVALCIRLESIFAELITRRWPNAADWLALLPDKDRKPLEKAVKRLTKERANPAAIELTDFRHKNFLIEKLFPADHDLARDADEIRQMRNDLVHGHDFARTYSDLEQFIGRLKLARCLIDRRYDEVAIP